MWNIDDPGVIYFNNKVCTLGSSVLWSKKRHSSLKSLFPALREPRATVNLKYHHNNILAELNDFQKSQKPIEDIYYKPIWKEKSVIDCTSVVQHHNDDVRYEFMIKTHYFIVVSFNVFKCTSNKRRVLLFCNNLDFLVSFFFSSGVLLRGRYDNNVHHGHHLRFESHFNYNYALIYCTVSIKCMDDNSCYVRDYTVFLLRSVNDYKKK